MPDQKYIKSNPVGIYEKLKKELKEDNSILFIGLPCQVAAVKKYVGKSLTSKIWQQIGFNLSWDTIS